MSQLNMVCLEDLVDADHIYRKFLELWSLDSVMAHLYDVENDSNYKGYGVLRLFSRNNTGQYHRCTGFKACVSGSRSNLCGQGLLCETSN